MKSDLIALSDANSFYASCETVFKPHLDNQPIIVVSNNDGCVVARSALAKLLGVEMGVPLFKIRDLIEQHGIRVFSSNYTLYGDLASRVVDVLDRFTPKQEVYSIDESFLLIPKFVSHYATEYGQTIRATVRQWTGIPISLGIAHTKVLAKIATWVAKQNPEYDGVFDFSQCPCPEKFLAEIEVREIWGIGHRYSKWLQSQGIDTALQLREADDNLIRKKMGVVGVRLLYELRGTSCLPLELIPKPKRETRVSRSFGTPIVNLNDLTDAIATFAARAAEKLRHQRQVASAMLVFARTSRFASEAYRNSTCVSFTVPTNYTPIIVKATRDATKHIYRSGCRFNQAGVVMIGLAPDHMVQGHLWETDGDWKRRQKLMDVMDQINHRFGQGTLIFAATGLSQSWQHRSQWRSPRYTTCWDELPIATA